MTPQYYLDHIATEEQRKAIVTKAHFLKALDELVPSVPAEELNRYHALRDRFDAKSKRGPTDVPEELLCHKRQRKGKGHMKYLDLMLLTRKCDPRSV